MNATIIKNRIAEATASTVVYTAIVAVPAFVAAGTVRVFCGPKAGKAALTDAIIATTAMGATMAVFNMCEAAHDIYTDHKILKAEAEANENVNTNDIYDATFEEDEEIA